jgi:hypothetical protein
MPVSISGDGAITGLELEAFEDVDVGSGASDGDVLTYDASGDLWIPQGIVPPAGIGSNVVTAVKDDTFSTSSTTFVTVTGLDVTITPTSATSKILLLATVAYSFFDQFDYHALFTVFRDSTDLVVPASPGSRVTGLGGIQNAQGIAKNQSGIHTMSQSVVILDSPATASAVNYTVRTLRSLGGAVNVNRSTTDANGATSVRSVSYLTAIEVAA